MHSLATPAVVVATFVAPCEPFQEIHKHHVEAFLRSVRAGAPTSVLRRCQDAAKMPTSAPSDSPFVSAAPPADEAPQPGNAGGRSGASYLETDPTTFAFSGYAAHLRGAFAQAPSWMFGVGAYALELPSFVPALHLNNALLPWAGAGASIELSRDPGIKTYDHLPALAYASVHVGWQF